MGSRYHGPTGLYIGPGADKRLDEKTPEELEAFFEYLNGEPEDTQQYEAWGS